MKILLINKYLYPKGGDAISTIQTYDLLRERGHDAYIWGMDHPKNPEYPLENYFVSRIEYDAHHSLGEKIALVTNLYYSLEAKKKMEIVLDNLKPDVVHLNNFAHQISPSIIDPIYNRKIPIVMTLHDYKLVCPAYTLLRKRNPCELCGKRRYYFCTLNRCTKGSYMKSLANTVEMYLHHVILRIYKKIDCFIAPSLFLKNKIEELGFEGNVTHIPNFIHNNSGRNVSRGKKANAIVFSGRLSAEKGLFTLLKAIRGIDVKLKIIGDGPCRTKLEKEVCASGIQSQVSFLGFIERSEALREMESSLFAVCPSEWYEVFSLFTLESFAVGIPVIGSRIGAIPELVKDGRTGFTFIPGNMHDLKEKIRYLLARPELSEEMGRIAREVAEKNYTGESHYAKLMALYRRLGI